MAGLVVGLGLIVTAAVGVGGGSKGHQSVATPSPFAVTLPPTATPGPAKTPGSAVAASTSAGNRRTSGSSPAQLSLTTLNVSAAVREVVTVHGVLGVPDDPAEVGWWTGSAKPGAIVGSVVIDGHVDSATRGIGALFHLTRLKIGDPVSVTTRAGAHVEYRVYARQIFSKHEPLPAGLFSTSGAARLVLITCGGPFDAATRSYEDNVVVLATPESA